MKTNFVNSDQKVFVVSLCLVLFHYKIEKIISHLVLLKEKISECKAIHYFLVCQKEHEWYCFK